MVKSSHSTPRRARELYVEGGGDRNPSLASECRRAFSKLFERAGVTQRPRVIACGGRGLAYKQFCDAHASSEADTWLLVDAEEVPKAQSPWDHVKARTGDGWDRPANASDDQLHLMTVCMETWLAADVAAMKDVFGPKLDDSKLPALDRLENMDKKAIYEALAAAAKPTKAGAYAKGSHSFKVLERVSPEAIRKLSWGKRFLDAMGATK
ncbi:MULTISPECIES: DUF4276 family protein [Sorangium]|uniref:DUF4276 family protein n=1 Tax=Sorangium cellulosum TaxID=56 RepID=A0A4P2QI50_SORCE|nr:MULTISPECIES: DUF4276 family protein [Sorangium]AUX29555.1 hypothetical protein SOCE836_016460 [Sorangium cellulosum]WCQ88951.1 hypothetical protein NQZ70_01634 [Sorangium sp. Soce836]